MSKPPFPRTVPRPAVLLLACAMAAAGGLGAGCGDDRPPLPDPFESAYRNTRPEVGYVGIAVCGECHPGELATYRETPHSRAFRPVETAREPWPGAVEHEQSGLVYEMHVQDGAPWIRQSVALPSGGTPVLSDRPVAYVVGSGESSLTYLAHDDGFLLESPTTWFTRKGGWAMSPGYDRPQHWGFSRAVSRQCLTCHVGRVEARNESDFQLTVGEGAIGCERCHGPGEAHVAFHRTKKLPDGARDPTIVVPTDLEPALLEDVCGQCHLDDTMVVRRPGLDFGDWRPGLPASRFRIHYGLETPGPLMRVVGHMDQVKASRCYQESGSMTCVTCHDPHGRPAPEERAAYYRRRCLSCHGEEACAMDAAQRLEQEPEDSCIACHMPTVGTDIVHFAFTHHRVGIHDGRDEPAGPMPADVVLEAKDDVSHVPAAERERDLGLAYWQFRRRPTGDPEAPFLPRPVLFAAVRRAQRHLDAAYAAGQRDPRLLVSLAELASLPPPPDAGGSPPRPPDLRAALRYLDEAFEHESEMSAATRLVGLHLRAGVLMRMGRGREALPVFETLVALRREAGDWAALADLHLRAGRREEALAAADRVLELRPSDPALQMRVAQLYASQGREEKAQLHRRIAEHLFAARRKAAARKPPGGSTPK